MNVEDIVKCECVYCPVVATWRQSFIVDNKIVIVRLCEGHHDVLRIKVPQDQPLNEDVLKWLLIQSSNLHKVARFGILKGFDDLRIMTELREIKLELKR